MLPIQRMCQKSVRIAAAIRRKISLADQDLTKAKRHKLFAYVMLIRQAPSHLTDGGEGLQNKAVVVAALLCADDKAVVFGKAF
jgi:hypothetical protein